LKRAESLLFEERHPRTPNLCLALSYFDIAPQYVKWLTGWHDNTSGNRRGMCFHAMPNANAIQRRREAAGSIQLVDLSRENYVVRCRGRVTRRACRDARSQGFDTTLRHMTKRYPRMDQILRKFVLVFSCVRHRSDSLLRISPRRFPHHPIV
jgi:hypothetical protein